jgi:hypothetical protein
MPSSLELTKPLICAERLYRRAILAWEHRLMRRDKNRTERIFDWGWDWLRDTPIDGLPPAPSGIDDLRSWNTRAIAASDIFFAYNRVSDYRLEDNLLRFSSPVSTRYPENNVVTAQWFEASNVGQSSGSPKSAVVILPQWNADTHGHIGLARALQRLGISALRISLPYHDTRMPSELRRAEFAVDCNLGRTIHAARQAVCDVRACLDWLEARGYMNFAIIGTSLGSCYALLTTAHEPRLKVNVFNHVSSYFGDVVWTGIGTRHVRRAIAAQIRGSELREAWRVISPASYLPRLIGTEKRNLLIYARYDPSFLPQFSQAVLNQFQVLKLHHEVRALPCGHYTTGEWPFNWMDGYAIVRFLRRELRDCN